MSEIAALQWTAVGTIALAVLAMVTAVFAFLAFQKQSEEVRLQGQELRREAAERRSAQACKVFISVEDRGADRPSLIAHVENTSREPVYDVRVRFIHPTEALPDREPIGTIMPDQECTDTIALPDEMERKFLPGRPGAIAEVIAVVRFRDAAGVTWERGPNGELEDLGGPLRSSPS